MFIYPQKDLSKSDRLRGLISYQGELVEYTNGKRYLVCQNLWCSHTYTFCSNKRKSKRLANKMFKQAVLAFLGDDV